MRKIGFFTAIVFVSLTWVAAGSGLPPEIADRLENASSTWRSVSTTSVRQRSPLNLHNEGVQYSDCSQRPPAARPKHSIAEDGGKEMAKGQVKKAKTNKPKLSAKEKKAKKAAKKAAKDAK